MWENKVIMRKKVSILFVFIFFTALSVRGQDRWQIPPYQVFGTPAVSSDALAIETLMEHFKAAWAKQDTKAILTTHAQDIEWINAYARIFRGTDALQVFLQDRLFPAFNPAVSKEEVNNMKAISLRYIGNDAALLHWYTDGHRGTSRNKDGKARRTHLHFVLGKKNGEWKIVHLAIFDARK